MDVPFSRRIDNLKAAVGLSVKSDSSKYSTDSHSTIRQSPMITDATYRSLFQGAGQSLAQASSSGSRETVDIFQPRPKSEMMDEAEGPTSIESSKRKNVILIGVHQVSFLWAPSDDKSR